MRLATYFRLVLVFSTVISLLTILLLYLFKDIADLLVLPKKYYVNEKKELSSFNNRKGVSSFVLEFPDPSILPNIEIARQPDIHKWDEDSEALMVLKAALQMLNSGKTSKAQKLLEHALALSPKHPDILNHYGEFVENVNNDIITADQLYVKALIQSPGHSRAFLNHDRIVAVVEEMDLSTLKRIDNKRSTLGSIPEANAALRKTKLESYFQHIYHSVGIEGNTMTLSETRSIVETKQTICGKSIIEHNEIIGMDAALKYINLTLINRIGRITLEDILGIHKRVLGHVDPLQGGKIRETQVFVGRHIPPHPSNLKSLMNQFEKWLNSWEALDMHPVKYAALAHYKLVYLHPFNDGNGRTARLLMNTILMQAGFPPTFILKQNRNRYYRTIELANDGDIRPFIRFIAECTEHTLDLYIWSTSKLSSKLPALANEMIKEERH